MKCASGVGLVERGEASHLERGEEGGMFDLLQRKPKIHAQGEEVGAIGLQRRGQD